MMTAPVLLNFESHSRSVVTTASSEMSIMVKIISTIKIIIYVDIAFFYRKANILHRWPNILRKFYGNKGVCHCCRSQ